MVGRALPHPLPRNSASSSDGSAAQATPAGLTLLAVAALAVAFGLLLLTAVVFDVSAQPCEPGAAGESCCVATSLDSFAAEACRNLP
jgi:hypothetical protein